MQDVPNKKYSTLIAIVLSLIVITIHNYESYFVGVVIYTMSKCCLYSSETKFKTFTL